MWATLGGQLDSVATDKGQLKATMAVTATSRYTDHAITQDSGVVVHEYTNSSGYVFAVAWAGPVMPDLQQLLGTYFSNLVAARQSQSGAAGGLSQFHATQNDLVMHSSGRLGAFKGVIYIPSLVPSGVDAEQLP